MKIPPFSIEQFFALYEFNTPHILCVSDCESMSVGEILEMSGHSMDAFADLRLGYTESQGGVEMRTAVADLYPDIAPEHVVSLAAPEEGIYLAMRALLEPDDHVVVLTPAYDSLLNLAETISGNVTRWEIQPTDGKWEIDLAQLEAVVTSQTKLIIVNFPHNPTGFLPALAEFDKILNIAAENGSWLFCDEMYRGLEREEADRLPSAAGRYGRSIILSGLSKVHGLPGLRSGWLIIEDETLREEVMNWKYYTSICPPAPSEFLATAVLHHHHKFVHRNRAIIRQNLAIADAFFARWPSLFTWRPPQAGSVALVGLHKPSATRYCHQLVADAGVLLLPSSCLGYGDSHIRMGFGRKNFEQDLGQYERYLSKRASGQVSR